MSATPQSFLRLLRIEQWVKNLFVFIPPFFAARMLEWPVLSRSVAGFIVFCIVASGVYIFNDICDAEHDKLHPEKKNRPIASGAISKNSARLMSGIALCLGLLLAWWMSSLFFTVCALYILINFTYSLWLKHFAIIDVSIIAIGFLLRVIAGAVIVQVPISHWLVVMTFLLALILGFAKRRGEYLIENQGGSTRRALDGYNLPFIDSSMLVSATVAVVAYLMYCFSPDVTQRIGSDRIYYTAFFVLIGLFRYLQLTFVYNRTESPTRALLKDHYLQLILLGWIGCFLWLLYFKKWAAGTWLGDLLG